VSLQSSQFMAGMYLGSLRSDRALGGKLAAGLGMLVNSTEGRNFALKVSLGLGLVTRPRH